MPALWAREHPLEILTGKFRGLPRKWRDAFASAIVLVHGAAGMAKANYSWRARLLNVRGLALCNLAALVLAVFVFFAIAEEVNEGEHQGLEERIMRSLRSGEPPHPIGPTWLASAARDITGMGSTVVLSLVVVLVTAYLILTRRYGAAIFLVIASLGGLALNTTLKELYGRERPDRLLRLVDADSLSFPSGHAMSSATIYLTLAVLLSRLTNSPREKLYVLAAALCVSFLVGLSRVFLGVHYPTDVIAGWAAGVMWAQICWFAAQFISRRRLTRAGREETNTA